MENVLDNPVWHALNSGNSNLARGTNEAKYFDIEVSPFIASRHVNTNALKQLYTLLPNNRISFLATPVTINIPAEWTIVTVVRGIQMVHNGNLVNNNEPHNIADLSATNCREMLHLAHLTKPGPFDIRTIEFGHYQGIFHENKLIAMAGQRMHAFNYAEISAVCTHPEHTGKGHARRLIINQVNRIISAGNTPFLHTKKDNTRAIGLYKSLGFSTRCDMYFYILKK